MKPDTKDILKGVGIAAGLQAAGAVIGAKTNPACSTPPSASDSYLCGPTGGAVLGDLTASGISTMVGLGLAVFSQKKRAVGVGMAVGPMAVNMTLGLAARLFGTSTPATTPLTAPATAPAGTATTNPPGQTLTSAAGTTPATPLVSATGST